METNSDSSPHFWSPAQKVPSFPSTSPSPVIRPWMLVLLTSIFLLLFTPSFLSSNFRGLRTSFVKHGWDSLNLALVVLAILCGLLSRDVSSEEGKGPAQQSIYEYNRTAGISRMRSSSSYPDLRQDFHSGNDWGIVDNWRFNDDIQLYRRQRSYTRELGTLDDRDVKLTKRLTTSPPETLFDSSPPSIQEVVATPLHPPPPPPPPPPPVYQQEKMKFHRKRSGAAAKDIATAIALFYNKNKRRNKAKKIHDDESLRSPAFPSTPPPPPPPPPPPTPSIFSQIFTHRKGGSKSKRFNTMAPIQFSPPPPPPPLPSPPSPLISRRPPRRKRNKKPTFPPPPPPPPLPSSPSSNSKAGNGKPVGEEAVAPFCPSPDVNNKAEMFIKRFHAGLKLEKQNSIRHKQGRMQEPPQERLEEAGIELDMEREIMTMMMMEFEDFADE